MSSRLRAEIVVDCRCRLGESPTWHAESQTVYWSDIARQELHRLQLQTGLHDVVLERKLISGITVERDGALILLGRWGAVYRFDGYAARPLHRWTASHFGYRFNDCIADPQGRVYAGIIGYEAGLAQIPWGGSLRRRLQRMGLQRLPDSREGKLCLLLNGGRAREIRRGLGRPNGMGFSPDLRTLYVTDSAARHILAYPYDADTGSIGDARIAVSTDAEPGAPDGLAIDEEGCLWSARHRGGAVVRYAPNGQQMMRIEVPTRRVTSLTFAGDDGKDLYVTSAQSPDADDRFGGSLFRISTEVCGAPVWRSNLCPSGIVVAEDAR
jgi:D-xylono/L-arabinono-1,4-lactonase